MSDTKWVRHDDGTYTSGNYTIFREGVNPQYPWAVKRGPVIVDLAATLRSAKLAADDDQSGQ